MTINSTTRKTNALVGNGNTATYPFAFKVFTDADVVVKKLEDATSIETTLTLGASNDYIVTRNSDQNGNPGGSITLRSGGNNQNLPSGFIIVITSAVEPLQGTDLTNQGGFFPEVINDALDKAIILHQQQQTELDKSIRFSLTNTIGSLEITENATDRANKVLGFDNLGEFEVLKELGSYRGNWTASRSYVVRDIVKDTSTNNIFFCNTAHTSSGSQPLTTNTNSANWDLIVDAATATTQAANAASSATAGASSATAAASSATAAASSATSASSSASTATTKATQADTAKTAAETAKTAAETAQTAAETALDTFDDRYLGAKSSDPTVDNDGNALIDGALYFNTTDNVTKVYDLGNTAWVLLKLTDANQTKVNTVQASISNVNTVAGDISNVNAVAGNASNINSVQGNASNINTVAGAVSNVNNVGNNISNVNTVAANNSNVTAVASDASDIGLVAGSIANVNLTGGSIANVNTTAASISNVNTVATNISNVGVAATNVADINNFADIYQISNSAPTQRADGTSLQDGDLWFNNSSDDLRVWNGTAWAIITPSQAVLDDVAIVSGVITYSEDLGLISDAVTTGSSNGSLDIVADAIEDEKTFTVTAATGKFIIDGVDKPALSLHKGWTYTFDVSDGSNALHPFRFSSGGSAYNTNVTVTGTQGQAGAKVVIKIPETQPTSFIYYCTSHSGMGNTITVVDDPIKLVADNVASIITTANNSSNINSVAGSVANVNTVGANIANVNNFANTYFISASAPGSPTNGDLWYDTANNVLKNYNGSAWLGITSNSGIASVADDSSPQLGGALDGQNNNLSNIGTIDGTNLQLDFGTI